MNTFEQFMKHYYGEDADWDEGWNRGNMKEAYEAGAEGKQELIEALEELLEEEVMHQSSWSHCKSHPCTCKGCRINKAKAALAKYGG